MIRVIFAATHDQVMSYSFILMKNVQIVWWNIKTLFLTWRQHWIWTIKFKSQSSSQVQILSQSTYQQIKAKFKHCCLGFKSCGLLSSTLRSLIRWFCNFPIAKGSIHFVIFQTISLIIFVFLYMAFVVQTPYNNSRNYIITNAMYIFYLYFLIIERNHNRRQ